MTHDDTDLAKVRESLRLARLELAQVREESEPMHEELARLRHAERRLVALSEHVVELTRQAVPTRNGVRGRLERRWRGVTLMPGELADVSRLEATPLFDAAWYVREYPQVLRFGLPPELHYLRKGARAGRNPGPNFDAARYRTQHPDLPRRANPLLHYLSTQSPSPS